MAAPAKVDGSEIKKLTGQKLWSLKLGISP